MKKSKKIKKLLEYVDRIPAVNDSSSNKDFREEYDKKVEIFNSKIRR